MGARQETALAATLTRVYPGRAGRTQPYLLAGLADYVSHCDERPIAITWELRHPLPGDTFANFRAAVA